MTTDAMNKSFRSKVVVVATPTKSVDFDYTVTLAGIYSFR